MGSHEGDDMAKSGAVPAADPAEDGKSSGLPRRWFAWGTVCLLLIGGLVYAAPKVRYAWTHESTDDAFVDGTLVTVAPEVGGRIVSVPVEEHARVRRGQILLEIDTSDYAADLERKKAELIRSRAERIEVGAQRIEAERALERARAEMEAAEAQAVLAEKQRRRSEGLLREDILPQEAYDRAEAEAKATAARLEAARQGVAEAKALLGTLAARATTRGFEIAEAGADMARTRLDLSRTTLRAPVSGVLATKAAEVGKYAQKGQTLFTLVSDERLWIVANFKETQIEGMRVGCPVDIRVDAYPGWVLKGHLESFRPGTGSVFSLLPPENATGNFVKVVQRVPVRIAIDTPPDPDRPLWPGLSVVPYVSKAR